MKLEELKQALASEATQKAERLEQEVHELEEQLKSKNETIKDYRNHLRVMFNRCYAVYNFGMCPVCGCKSLCDKLRDVGEKIQ